MNGARDLKLRVKSRYNLNYGNSNLTFSLILNEISIDGIATLGIKRIVNG